MYVIMPVMKLKALILNRADIDNDETQSTIIETAMYSPHKTHIIIKIVLHSVLSNELH